jgi:hypothetical protein|tara:strand:- start:482 stop:760 length:279 start_codon:yes stop_codon:yes gene_type:complete
MAGQDLTEERILQKIADDNAQRKIDEGRDFTENLEPFDIVAILRQLLGDAVGPGGDGPKRTRNINLPSDRQKELTYDEEMGTPRIPVRRRQP